MNLTKENLRYLKETAIKAASEAGELIIKYSNRDISIDRKIDYFCAILKNKKLLWIIQL